jgi:prepilin-type N-terminal cleavage/methylation domain-containing protein
MKKNRAFTLIELLVVISIIGLLSSVVLTSLSTSRVRARRAAVQAALKGVSGLAALCDSVGSTLVSGSPTGGTTNICNNSTSVVGRFPALPANWSYDTNVDAAAGDGAFQYEADGEGATIRCTAAGCVTL